MNHPPDTPCLLPYAFPWFFLLRRGFHQKHSRIITVVVAVAKGISSALRNFLEVDKLNGVALGSLGMSPWRSKHVLSHTQGEAATICDKDVRRERAKQGKAQSCQNQITGNKIFHSDDFFFDPFPCTISLSGLRC